MVPLRVCRKCGKRTTRFYVSGGRVLHPCKACSIADDKADRQKLRRAVKDIRATHATLMVVNPRLTKYRERWKWCGNGWVLLKESPA